MAEYSQQELIIGAGVFLGSLACCIGSLLCKAEREYRIEQAERERRYMEQRIVNEPLSPQTVITGTVLYQPPIQQTMPGQITHSIRERTPPRSSNNIPIDLKPGREPESEPQSKMTMP